MFLDRDKLSFNSYLKLIENKEKYFSINEKDMMFQNKEELIIKKWVLVKLRSILWK